MDEKVFVSKYGINNTILELELRKQGYNRNFESVAHAMGYRWLPTLNIWVHLKTNFETKTEKKFFRENII